jgi:trans-2,3-dihydro-3-hydroxyanthranilate isomerase
VPTLPYHVLDVFTDRPYAGNPLAVVLDGDDLSTESMQAIAREFNLSETTFPTSSDRADYAVRIFTPGTELPFAGHPSIGTAWLLARLGRIPAGEVRQDCAAGVLPVAVTGSGATLTGGAPTVSDPLDAEPLLHSVGLEAGSLGRDRPAADRRHRAGVDLPGGGGRCGRPGRRRTGSGWPGRCRPPASRSSPGPRGSRTCGR